MRGFDDQRRGGRHVKQQVLRLHQAAGGDEARRAVDVDGQVLLLHVKPLVLQRLQKTLLRLAPRPGLHLRLAAQAVQRREPPMN
jgi:hypothetical protein